MGKTVLGVSAAVKEDDLICCPQYQRITGNHQLLRYLSDKRNRKTAALYCTGLDLITGQILCQIVDIIVPVQIDSQNDHKQDDDQRHNGQDNSLDFFYLKISAVSRKIIGIFLFAITKKLSRLDHHPFLQKEDKILSSDKDRQPER